MACIHAPGFQPCTMTLVHSAATGAYFVMFCTKNVDTWMKYPPTLCRLTVSAIKTVADSTSGCLL